MEKVYFLELSLRAEPEVTAKADRYVSLLEVLTLY